MLLSLWHEDVNQEVRYVENMIDIMSKYSIHPRHPPHKLEMFVGTLIDKDGKHSRRQANIQSACTAELSTTMLNVDRITRQTVDGEELSDAEALGSSIACVAVAMERNNLAGKQRRMRSWGWVAVAACLKQMGNTGISM